MSLEFGILGPLEVVSDGTPVALPAMRERKLLAILLVNANEVVSTDRLVQELWGDHPPKTAIPALHNAVSRLRKALGETALQTRTPGYTLEIADDELDASRFERLVKEAAGTPPDEAAEQLREALSLWRGPALVDFAYEPFAQSAIARLEELHIVAIEERIEADLALGRHDVLVGELGSLILDHPFRERLRRQLMVALYRAGRQADALAAYQTARRVLSDELGVEPSPALKDLERAILQHDPSLAVAEAGPAAVVPTLPAEFGGERRRTVTVVLADIEPGRGGSELDPEAFRAAVSRCLGMLRATLERYGATVERFTGDAVIGIFGVPRAHEDDAMRGVLAAWAAQSALADLNRELRADWGVEFDFGFGLATGKVIEGGSEGLVTGPAMALAKRLQKNAPPGEILISDPTWRLVRDGVSAEETSVGADGDAATAWRVRDVEDLRPGRQLESSLVGRKNELRQLRHAFERAVETRAAHLATVLGPPGIGKSRLALELATEVAADATVVSGRCPPFGEGMTYWPLSEIARQVSGEAASRVAELIAGAPGADELFVAARRMLQALAKEQPLLVVLEDLHWAEPTFLDLVDYLVEWLHESPVLIVCLARPDLIEERPTWGGGKLNSTSVLLEPLSAGESDELLDAVSGATEVSAEARAKLLEAAEGNPLFVEQLATALLLGEAATLPPTLEGLLAARLDRLGPGERAVVDAAAVAGREFSGPGVQELLPEAAGSVERHLGGLVRRDLIRPLRDPLLGEEAFAFRHVLVREAAYRTTPKARRSYLHRRFAARLKRRVPDNDELIGYHLEHAWLLQAEVGPVSEGDVRLAGEAGERLGQAGVRAWKRGDAPATVNLLGRSTSLLPEGALRSELQCELGVALRAGGNLEEAEDMFTGVVENAGNRRLELRAAIELADLRMSTDSGSRASELLDLAEEATPVFEAADDDRSLGRTWLLVGEIRGGAYCDNAAWETAATRALQHYERSGWPIASAVQAITAALYYGPTPVEEGIERCRAFVEEYPEGVGVSALLVEGGLEALMGEFDEARALVATAREQYLELGQRIRAAELVDSVQAGVELVAGNTEAAEELLRASCERLQEMQAFSALATRAAQLAEALYRLGRYAEAEEWTHVSQRHTGADDIGAQFSWRGVHAKLIARRGDFEAAEVLAREAVALAEGTDAVNQHAQALLDLAEVLRGADRPDDATAATKGALSLFERKGNIPDAARARALLDKPADNRRGPKRKAPDGAFRTA